MGRNPNKHKLFLDWYFWNGFLCCFKKSWKENITKEIQKIYRWPEAKDYKRRSNGMIQKLIRKTFAEISSFGNISIRYSFNIIKILYTFSSSSTQCQKITNIYMGYGQLMISNNQFFVLGLPTSGPKSLKMFKITFSSTAVDWANQIVCTSETWSTSSSESLLSSDKSKIYSFFIFGMSSKYLNFAGLSVLDGSVVTTRYISDTSVSNVRGSALNGDYMVRQIMILNKLQLEAK